MANTKENLKHEGINIGGDLKVYGDFIAPGAKKEVTFTGGRHYHGVPAPDQDIAEEEEAEDDRSHPAAEEDIVEELAPIFYHDKKVVRQFLKQIRGVKPTEVTKQVNILIREGKVSTKSCQKELWIVLSRHGLYGRTYQNWHNQINVKAR